MDTIGRRPRHRLRNALKYIALFIVASILVVLLASMILPNHDSIAAAREGLSRYSLVLMSIRLSAIGLLWLYWHPLMRWLYKDRAPKALVHMQSRRNYFVLVFVAVELLLIQNIVGWLWALLT